MPKDWKELSDDEILNFEGPQTAEIARYERIMRQRSIESLREVKSELNQLAHRISSSTDRFVGVGNRLIATIEAESKAQSRQQRAVIWLTVVIAVATVAYVIATWVSVQAMHEANELQRQQIEQEQSERGEPNDAMQPTLVPRAAAG